MSLSSSLAGGGRPRAQAAPQPQPTPQQKPTPRQRRLHNNKQQRLQKQKEPRLELDTPAGSAAAATPAAATLDCPHFSACSGCTLDTQLDRPSVLGDAVRFFEGHGYPDFRLHAGSVRGWRRRARLAVRPGRDGRPAIGLFEEGSHTVTPIPACVVHHPAINAAVRLVRRAMAACSVRPYDEASGSGDLRYLQLTVVQPEASSTGGAAGAPAVQLALVWNAAQPDARLAALADHLWLAGQGGRGGTPLLHSVWANLQPERTNAIFGDGGWLLLHGEELAWARLGGADICFTPGSFMQANGRAMDRCLVAVQQHVPTGSTVVDMHAGVGTIGLSLAATRGLRWVRFVEINGQGRPAFEHSAARLRQQLGAAANGGSDGSTGSGSAVEPLALEYHVAAAGSDPGRWCVGAEVVVCDPPRKGLEPELLAWLCSPAAAAAGVRRLVYLSCGWPALQHDCAALLGSGRWRLHSAEAFLFFPGADHIETLVVADLVP